jgi:O-antigen/teichoic acid export membrane protein
MAFVPRARSRVRATSPRAESGDGLEGQPPGTRTGLVSNYGDGSEGQPLKTGTGLVSNYGFLVVGSLGSQLVGLIGLALVSRRVGPSGLGDFAFATSMASYFALPLLPGFALLGTRRVTTAAPTDRARIVFELQSLSVANSIVAWIAMLLGAALLTPNPHAAQLLPILGLSVVINAVGIGWALQGLRQMRKIAVIGLTSQILYLAVVLILVASARITVLGYAWANIAGFATGAILFSWSAWRTIGRPAFRGPQRVFGEPRAVRNLLRATLPLSTSAIMLQVYLYSAVILLGVLATPSAVGQYNVASRLPLAILFLSMLWGMVFFPHAADLWQHNREQLLRQVSHFATLAAVLFLPTVPIAASVGSGLLGTLFGQSFRPGGLTFTFLVGFSWLSMINVNVTNLMLAAGDDRGFMIRALVAAVACVGFGVAMIPIWGPPGAAAAIVLAELIAIGLALLRISRVLGKMPWPQPRRALGALTGLSVTIVTLVVFTHAPWILRALVGSLVYFAVVFALRAIRPSDLRTPA